MWLWLSLMQSTAWLGLALLVTRDAARRPARAHAVLVVGLVGAVVTPVLTGVSMLLGLGLIEGPGPATRFAVAEPNPPPAAGPWLPTSPVAWATTVMAAGTLVMLLRLALRWRAGGRMFAGRPVDDAGLTAAFGRAARGLGLRRVPALVRAAAARSPLAWGAGRRPRVVLPEQLGFRDLPPHSWELVFRHELAHLRRRDGWAAVAADAAVALLWWHPLAWVVRARRTLAAEYACDDWALAGTNPAADYADSVLALMTPPGRAVPVGGAAVAGRQVMLRLRRVLVRSAVPRPEAGLRWLCGLAAAAGVLAVALALTQARPGSRGTPPLRPDARATAQVQHPKPPGPGR